MFGSCCHADDQVDHFDNHSLAQCRVNGKLHVYNPLTYKTRICFAVKQTQMESIRKKQIYTFNSIPACISKFECSPTSTKCMYSEIMVPFPDKCLCSGERTTKQGITSAKHFQPKKCALPTYLIIVADVADAVSVNFFGRCKFLQI